jgi:redox-sensitive bicupin YhaK (pirin superfamily)
MKGTPMASTNKSIEVILKPEVKDLGGFTVRRLLPAGSRQSLGPFVFFDHFGPVSFPPGVGAMDVRPHPHIGLATVSFLFDGAITHRDSLGFVQDIVPGDVNWMTAGRGIVHSERTPRALREKGFSLHGLQTWVALPKECEACAPAFEHHSARTLPKWESGGVTFTVVAGRFQGHSSPARTFSETLYVFASCSAGSEFLVPTEHEERGVYLVDGQAMLNDTPLNPGELVVLAPGAQPRLNALSDVRVFLVGGAPLDGHRHIWWNFVASERATIEEAKKRWTSGAFGVVPDETEFIPLPEVSLGRT